MTSNATGEAQTGPLRLQIDRSVKLAFRGAAASSDGGLLLHRELDDALGLTDLAAGLLFDARTGQNRREARAPRPLGHLPAGRGGAATLGIRGGPRQHQRPARPARRGGMRVTGPAPGPSAFDGRGGRSVPWPSRNCIPASGRRPAAGLSASRTSIQHPAWQRTQFPDALMAAIPGRTDPTGISAESRHLESFIVLCVFGLLRPG